MDSFVHLGDGVDEASYFKTILDSARVKTESASYTERRAQEMTAGGDMDDFDIEGKYL